MQRKLIKADLFRALSRGFAYPDEDNCREVKEILTNCLEKKVLDKRSQELIMRLLRELDNTDVLKAYSDFFMKGHIPLTEGYCCSRMHSVTDVSAFYKAFGLNPKKGENPDALTYELEFAAMLLVKESMAENEEEKEITKDAYQKFMDDHLVDFSKQFIEKLRSFKPDPYYRTLATLLRLWVVDKHSVRPVNTMAD